MIDEQDVQRSKGALKISVSFQLSSALGAGLVLVVEGAEVRSEAGAHWTPLPRKVQGNRRAVELARRNNPACLRVGEVSSESKLV